MSCGGLCAGRAFLIPRHPPIETLAKQYNSWLWGTRIQELNQFSQEYRKNSEVFRTIQNNSEQFRTIQTEFRQYLEGCFLLPIPTLDSPAKRYKSLPRGTRQSIPISLQYKIIQNNSDEFRIIRQNLDEFRSQQENQT